MLENKFSFGFFPTPLHELKWITKEFPDYNIFIKRDDNTGLATGGNKTRKLEYLVKQAVDLGCDTIITAGAQQSNHCRQTAAACSKVGLNCHLLLRGDEPDTYQGNLLLSKILGATLHFAGDDVKAQTLEFFKQKLDNEGKKCYVIPYGGSNLTGALGFVNAVKELKEQLSAMELDIDYIFFASCSGGTQAGLTLGRELYKLKAELMPISIDKNETNGLTLEQAILNIVLEGAQKLNITKQFQLSDIKLLRGYDSAGYGVITDNEIDAINLMARNEGILLDPVYTGRAFWGMLDILKRKAIPSKSNVLFWHTGGSSSLFYYNDIFDK
ncbi:1-aminocyclopropane-1-carboxylate deaminase/D-cysteine desulfhydrase [Tenuifilum thalassicum]|uniref:D-cysteine desulfhydrase family protein n=1 Tax=Tenuifilum thalassicum TaxID=2590900 RepID=A0A7D3XDN2_9BACT|nr:D-cysteine desulfhydrase family protein [Tenuifilum thalassicum]QKG79227.1 D-cysteine desulfhydrase family protein [Tenuifilum thalassicum]